MDDDSRALDKGWDALPDYGKSSGDADEAVTVSISTAPNEWLVNTTESVVVPMSMAEVVVALQSHKLNDRSLVWRNGMQEWQPVERVPQLKLAARMPSVAPRATPPSRPAPPQSLRATTTPQGTPRDSVSPQVAHGQRPTLPGLPAPSHPRSSSPRSSSPRSSSPRSSSPRPPVPRATLPPAASDEADVLAVYERPAATISFELAPQEPPRSEAPSLKAPHTLAPTTTDYGSRRPADLSVVAASQFRQVQRSSQRLLWLSSLGSAAAASLLTLWLSSGSTPTRGAAATAPAPPSASELAPSRPSAAKVAPAPLPQLAEEAPAPSAASSSSVVKAKPKAKRRARAVARVAPAATPAATAQDPSTEPNPYDVKLEDDPPAAPSPPAADGVAPEAVSSGAESTPTSGSALPGF